MSNTPKLVRPKEAARILGIGRDKVYDWIHRNIIPSVREGKLGRIYIAASALDNVAARIARGELSPTA